MKCNVGGSEKTLRIFFGVVCFALILLLPMIAPGKILFGLLGGYSLITGAIGFCPLNLVVGRDTCGDPGSRG